MDKIEHSNSWNRWTSSDLFLISVDYQRLIVSFYSDWQFICSDSCIFSPEFNESMFQNWAQKDIDINNSVLSFLAKDQLHFSSSLVFNSCCNCHINITGWNEIARYHTSTLKFGTIIEFKCKLLSFKGDTKKNIPWRLDSLNRYSTPYFSLKSTVRFFHPFNRFIFVNALIECILMPWINGCTII